MKISKEFKRITNLLKAIKSVKDEAKYIMKEIVTGRNMLDDLNERCKFDLKA